MSKETKASHVYLEHSTEGPMTVTGEQWEGPLRRALSGDVGKVGPLFFFRKMPSSNKIF